MAFSYKSYSDQIPFMDVSPPGRLIALEGPDGAGKTSLAKALKERLRTRGYDAVTTKFPTSRVRQSSMFRRFARDGRHDAVDRVAMQALHMTDRLQHTHELIRPALESGKIVIADRYMTGSLGVLQTHQLPTVWFFDLTQLLYRPSLWLWLYASVDVAIERIHRRLHERHVNINREAYAEALELGHKIASMYGLYVLQTDDHSVASCMDAFDTVLREALAGAPKCSHSCS